MLTKHINGNQYNDLALMTIKLCVCRWLHMKNYQARLDAQRKLELQRFYFKQGKRLKESLRARYVFQYA